MADSVVSSSSPIFAGAEPPASTAYYQKWLNTTNGQTFEYTGGEWVPTSGGVSVEPTTDEVKITHIKIENGIIVEFEWEDMEE